MSLSRLFAAWAITRPTAASKKRPRLKPFARTASRPAIAAAVSVIGWTQARVRTNHRETKSFAPAGALQVDTAARQAIGGPRTLPACASTEPSLGAAEEWRRKLRPVARMCMVPGGGAALDRGSGFLEGGHVLTVREQGRPLLDPPRAADRRTLRAGPADRRRAPRGP